jgi:hypothetical protein
VVAAGPMSITPWENFESSESVVACELMQCLINSKNILLPTKLLVSEIVLEVFIN